MMVSQIQILNPTVAGRFPSQMVSNEETVSMSYGDQ